MSSTFWIELSHSNSKDKVTVFSTLFKTWLTSGSRPRPSNNHETNSTSWNYNSTLWMKIHDSCPEIKEPKTAGPGLEILIGLGPDWSVKFTDNFKIITLIIAIYFDETTCKYVCLTHLTNGYFWLKNTKYEQKFWVLTQINLIN